MRPFQESWRWHPKEENLVHDNCIGSVLHVCSGHSPLFGVRLDLHEKADIKGSALALPIKDNAFDTVVCDPPWNLGFIPHFWQELTRVAAKRIITIGLAAMPNWKGWNRSKTKVLKNFGGFQLKVFCMWDKNGDITGYF